MPFLFAAGKRCRLIRASLLTNGARSPPSPAADGQPVDWLPVDLVGKPELPNFCRALSRRPQRHSSRHGPHGDPGHLFLRALRKPPSPCTFPSPKASSPSGIRTRPAFSLPLRSPSDALYQPHDDGSIAWDSITVAPNLASDFPREKAASRYYAARETSATPLSVQGAHRRAARKISLLSRRLHRLSPPLRQSPALRRDSCSTIGPASPFPSLIVFERRGDKLGYHIVTSPQDHAILETPVRQRHVRLSARATSKIILVAQGLYPDEADAMLETWGDSWFEEGSRLIYIVPRRYTSTRSFRSPSLPHPLNSRESSSAASSSSLRPRKNPSKPPSLPTTAATLKKYGRFLYPIFSVIIAKAARSRSRGSPLGTSSALPSPRIPPRIRSVRERSRRSVSRPSLPRLDPIAPAATMKIHSDAFFRFDEFLLQPSGHPLGCAVLCLLRHEICQRPISNARME